MPRGVYERSEKEKERFRKLRIGIPSFNKGQHLTEEWKIKISVGQQKRKERDGYINSLETRKKISIAKKGNKNWEGRCHSKETKIKISIAKTGKHHSETAKIKRKENNNAGFRGKHHSAETKEKLRAFNLGKSMPMEDREKISEARIKYLSSGRCRGKGKTFDTKIELKVQAELDRKGIVYVHPYNAEGIACVDFYIPEHKLIIQCDGDYWHSIKVNKGKDIAQDTALGFLGYKVYRFWEHEINKSTKECIDRVSELKSSTIRDVSSSVNLK